MGFSSKQLAYAQSIMAVGDRLGATMADKKTALVVALDESELQMYANSKVPESLKLPHDAIGSDGLSVGLFQQQVGIWGDAATLMNTEASALLFFHALMAVPNRAAMSIPKAAQTVQRSAFLDGSNYADKMGEADTLMAALGTTGGTGATPVTAGSSGNWLAEHGGWQRIGIFALGVAILTFAVVYMLGQNKDVQTAIKAAVVL
jgi:hypothetical protein